MASLALSVLQEASNMLLRCWGEKIPQTCCKVWGTPILLVVSVVADTVLVSQCKPEMSIYQELLKWQENVRLLGFLPP